MREGVKCNVGVGGLNVQVHPKEKLNLAAIAIFCLKALEIVLKLDIKGQNDFVLVVTLSFQNIATNVASVDYSSVLVCNTIGGRVGECGHGR